MSIAWRFSSVSIRSGWMVTVTRWPGVSSGAVISILPSGPTTASRLIMVVMRALHSGSWRVCGQDTTCRRATGVRWTPLRGGRGSVKRVGFPSTALRRGGAADELDLVAVGVVHVHCAAGQNGVLAAARRESGGEKCFALRVKGVFRKLQRQMVELPAGRFGLDLLGFGHQHDHLRDASVALSDLEEDIGQCGQRNDFQPQQIAIELERPLH